MGSKSIGYSYHNSEQDMFWARSFNWLKHNHPDDTELFLLFGRNAYMKTRNIDGDNAFKHLKGKGYSVVILSFKKIYFKLYARMRNFAKHKFSSISFIVLHFAFKSMVHFD